VKRTYVAFNGRHYQLTQRHDGTVEIFTEWEVISIGYAHMVHPPKIRKTAYVSPYGRLGKKIMKLAVWPK
jgi:hypothetical protein